jgi:hypothetical protein
MAGRRASGLTLVAAAPRLFGCYSLACRRHRDHQDRHEQADRPGEAIDRHGKGRRSAQRQGCDSRPPEYRRIDASRRPRQRAPQLLISQERRSRQRQSRQSQAQLDDTRQKPVLN